MKKQILSLLLACVLLLCPALASCGGTEMEAPDFTVVDAKGQTLRLSDCKGKPIVINFWATWCPPCVAELPHFNKAAETYGDRVVFLMVNVNGHGEEDIPTALAFMEENNYNFPVYFDLDFTASAAYEVTGIPQTVWIDKTGKPVNTAVGMVSEEYLFYHIENLLKEA